MNIFFDIDYTIIEIDNGTLRPGVEHTFERLRADGHTLFIWSGIGARTEEVKALGLYSLVDGVFAKPWENYEQSVEYMLSSGEIPVRPDLVIDDTAALVRSLGGIVVTQYGSLSPADDREMERVYRIIQDIMSHGHSDDRAYRPLLSRRNAPPGQ